MQAGFRVSILYGPLKDAQTAAVGLAQAATTDITGQIIPGLKQALSDFGNENKLVVTVTTTVTATLVPK